MPVSWVVEAVGEFVAEVVLGVIWDGAVDAVIDGAKRVRGVPRAEVDAAREKRREERDHRRKNLRFRAKPGWRGERRGRPKHG